MSPSQLMRDAGVRRAAMGLGVAAVIFMALSVRAIRIDEIPDAAGAPLDATLLASSGARGAGDAADIGAAVALDPFAASRSAPAKRYTLPWEVGEAKVTEAAPKPQVLGTAISLDGKNFATCQLGSDTPRIVHIGDRMGEYTVKSIARGRVVFTTSSGSTLDISALK